MYAVYFQTNYAVKFCWLWDIYRDGHRLGRGSGATMADAMAQATKKMEEVSRG